MKKKRWSVGRLMAIAVCLLLILGGALYIVQWEQTRSRIERENALWSALYTAQSKTPAPTASPSDAPVPSPMFAAEVSKASTAAPAASPELTASAEASKAPTATPAASPEPSATLEAAVDATVVPRATADADTIVYALETAPPVQSAFADLLSLNPDAIGFLHLDDVLSLPVVQRANDNEFYLSHSFNLEESAAGTLFLDGSNLLVPEDDCLIIYGHNMRNGTMFRPLIGYEQLSFLKEHPLLHFDTLYENRTYVPFAVFTVAADSDSGQYLNIRQFDLDADDWADFIARMRNLSKHDIPVDVAYGDHVLLLVTCEYTHHNGRFVVALRAQRDGESEDALKAQVLMAQASGN